MIRHRRRLSPLAVDTMPTRTKPAAERRAELLDAAEELFVEQGIAATTVEEVTNRAGVSKGSFYLHYRSKEEIVAALQDRFAERLATALAAAAARQADWGRKLDAIVNAFHRTYMSQVELHDALWLQPPPLGREPAAGTQLPQIVIRDLLAAGVAAGAYRVENAELTALLVLSAIHGAFEAKPDGKRPPRAAILRAARQLVRRAAGYAE